jgi:phenolphthiocerol/phthiocerol/phthiodiolone dimycocerosyl transferase
VEVTATHGELYFAVSAGIEIYFTQIYADQLNIEYNSHGPEPEKSVAAIQAQLIAVAEQHATSGVS